MSACRPLRTMQRRYDDAAQRTITHYDAPTGGATQRLDVPAARVTRFRAPSSRLGTLYDAPAPRRTVTAA